MGKGMKLVNVMYKAKTHKKPNFMYETSKKWFPCEGWSSVWEFVAWENRRDFRVRGIKLQRIHCFAVFSFPESWVRF